MKKLLFIFLLFFFKFSFSQYDTIMVKAREYLENQQFDLASQYFSKVLQLDPVNVHALVGLGKCYLEAGDTTTAKQYFQEAINVDSTQFEGYQALAQYYLQKGEYRKALKIFELAKKYLTYDSRVYAWLGVVYMLLHNDAVAHRYFNMALADIQSTSVFNIISNGYAQVEKYDTAIAYLDYAMRYFPDNDTLYFYRSQQEVKAGYIDRAVSDMDTAIALNPGDLRYKLEKMSILLYAGRFKQAVKYGKSEMNSVKDSNFYYLFGYAMMQESKDLDSVLSIINQGIEYTGAASLYYLAGTVYNLKREYDSAYENFKVAAEKDPWEIKYYREMVIAKLLANTPDLDKYLYFKDFKADNLTEFKKLVKNKKSKYYYTNVLNKFLEDPLSLGLDEYLMLYIGQSTLKSFSPLRRKEEYMKSQALMKNDMQDGIIKAENYLTGDLANIGLYYLLAKGYFYLADLDGFRRNYVPYLGFILALRSTGSGKDEKNSIISASGMDELMLLQFFTYDQLIGVVTKKSKEHTYKIYKVAKDGQLTNYYFNVDLYSRFLSE